MPRIIYSLRIFCFLGVICAQISFVAQAAPKVRLVWDPSPDPDIVGYAAYYEDTDTGEVNRADMGTATIGELSGLERGKAYSISVVAINSSGVESVPSNSVQFSFRGGSNGSSSPTPSAPSIDVVSAPTAAPVTAAPSGSTESSPTPPPPQETTTVPESTPPPAITVIPSPAPAPAAVTAVESTDTSTSSTAPAPAPATTAPVASTDTSTSSTPSTPPPPLINIISIGSTLHIRSSSSSLAAGGAAASPDLAAPVKTVASATGSQSARVVLAPANSPGSTPAHWWVKYGAAEQGLASTAKSAWLKIEKNLRQLHLRWPNAPHLRVEICDDLSQGWRPLEERPVITQDECHLPLALNSQLQLFRLVVDRLSAPAR